ncbi:4'-phosphopantetheinyl transferase superfamily protein [Streptomyces sp. SP17BM10]|uniref:4'-phosphopantetheinyl transferase family protein n=1 Tax=Streptomyces sp. SP17BM10 TaxID=3002530 RepID=UPI002E78674F|nr:4'-phosphopantetheinyl transferase superfamily protein [Streptomyces sp. SP17BM10]MEE1781612.1 4'-phosphopantetheinyl transferase superfamily protein [Streptomyces sp. SP17BM10]
MLSTMLPSCVSAEESRQDLVEIELFPEEEAHVTNAVRQRRAEFTTVRWCARRAMGRLGLAPAPIVPSRRGAPGWDERLVGSMTHCRGYRAAAVAWKTDVHSIGIDAERNDPLPQGLLESIALPSEHAWVRDLLRTGGPVAWDRLLFSMKEAVFKTWYPLTGRELDFEEARITVDPEEGTFRARLLVDPGTELCPQVLSGRWFADEEILLSSIALTVPAPVRRAAPHEVLVRG